MIARQRWLPALQFPFFGRFHTGASSRDIARGCRCRSSSLGGVLHVLRSEHDRVRVLAVECECNILIGRVAKQLDHVLQWHSHPVGFGKPAVYGVL